MKLLLAYPPGINLDYQMSIPCLSAYLKKHGHKDVEVLDAATLGLNLDETFNRIRDSNPDVLGISIPFTPYAPAAYEVMDRVKKELPWITIIAGGVHATLMPEETIKHCDYVILGEGEKMLLDFMQNPTKPPTEKLLESDELLDLNELPDPDWECVPSEKYIGEFPILSSRGCPFHCNFCANWILSKRRIRYVPIKSIIRQIRQARAKYGHNMFHFRDETFTMKPERVWELCEHIKPLNIRWSCQTRAHLVDDDLLGTMKDAGCCQIGVGVESGNEEILAKIPKLETKQQIKEGISKIKKSGIQVNAGFILGHPWDTPSTVAETIEFADEVDVDLAGFAIATPYPGTELRATAEKEGGIQTNNWAEYYTTHVTYIPPGLDGYKMKCLRRKAEIIFNAKKTNRMKNRANMHLPSFLLLMPWILGEWLFGWTKNTREKLEACRCSN